MQIFAHFQHVTPAIWTLGHKSKKADVSRCVCPWRVLCPNISKFDDELKDVRVWRDPLSTRLELAAVVGCAGVTSAVCMPTLIGCRQYSNHCECDASCPYGLLKMKAAI